MKPYGKEPDDPNRDQADRPVDEITGTEHDFSGKLEDWEDRVFRTAVRTGHFTVTKKLSRGKLETETFQHFSAAALAAWDDAEKLVYAVTRSGRFVCLIRKRWQHYLDIQKELMK